MRNLEKISDRWDKLSELKKFRIMLLVLVETEPVVRVAAVLAHALIVGVFVMLLMLHLGVEAAMYLCAVVAVSVTFHALPRMPF